MNNDEDFLELLKVIDESGKTYDLEKIKRAYEMANSAHENQFRVSGEPYIMHPVAVATILVNLGMDTDSIVGALLHDVVEDTDISLETVKKEFSEDVAVLVDGVTKIGRLSFETQEEQQQENVRKMLMAMNQDIRVIIIKLADRLHNMRTMDAMPRDKQRIKSKETMDVYAPIAHRLGIRPVKEELEDRSLWYLDPDGYKEILEDLNQQKEEREAFLAQIKTRMENRMEEQGIEGTVSARVKSVYGIYRKMYMQGKTFDEIYDVYAIRVIVDTIADCYMVLGLAHDMFTPIPNRFKDYISTPKPNLYQSLHTTVLDKEGIPFEIQIRTKEMHQTAELGIAAHWKYKAGVAGKDNMEERISWIRQLLESDDADMDDIVHSIKGDLSQEEVFVFTPGGEVKILPISSTIIDFAYSIHSEVGNHMVGAKVNNRIIGIDHELQTGEIVEILTSNNPNQGPSRDWLHMVKTSGARSKIRNWFKKEKKEENIAQGKAELEREFRRNLIRLTDEQEEEFLEEIAKHQRCNSVEDLYAAIGYGGLQLSNIMPRIRDEYNKKYRKTEEKFIEEMLIRPEETRRENERAKSGVVVDGMGDMLVKFAQCCSPVPGDSIIGFITRGYGVSIHKQDCTNVTHSLERGEELERWIPAHWAGEVEKTFRVTLDLIVENRTGMLVDISVRLTNMRLSIHELNARELKDGFSKISLTISVSSTEQLNSVINTLKQIDGVEDVRRSGK